MYFERMWKYYLRLLTFFDCMFIQFVQLSGIKFCKLRDKNPQISEEKEKRNCNSSFNFFSLYYIAEHGFDWNYLNSTSSHMKCYIISTVLPNNNKCYVVVNKTFERLIPLTIFHFFVFIINTSECEVHGQ